MPCLQPPALRRTLAAPIGAALGALATSSAQAHAGDHGVLASLADALNHLLSAPDHLALLAGAAAVGVLAWRRRGPARRAAQDQRGRRP